MEIVPSESVNHSLIFLVFLSLYFSFFFKSPFCEVSSPYPSIEFILALLFLISKSSFYSLSVPCSWYFLFYEYNILCYLLEDTSSTWWVLLVFIFISSGFIFFSLLCVLLFLMAFPNICSFFAICFVKGLN